MMLTEEAIGLVKRFEGFRAGAYRDAVGVWTIGYGHTAMAGPPDVRAGMAMSRTEAEDVLRRDLAMFAQGVASALKASLAPAQFSALVSFAYNVGLGNFRKSSVLKAVNEGNFDAVPRRLQLWVKAGGRVLPGLVKRRAAEAELFMSASVPEHPGPAAGAGIEPVTGKPLRRSTTSLAAVLSAIAGALSSALAALGDAAKSLGGPLPALVLAAIIVLAAIWVLRERHRKSTEEGV